MSKLGINKSLTKLEQLKYKLPKQLANDAVRFFLDGFKKGGFTDSAFTTWAARKGKQEGRNATRAVLVDSGDLREAVSNSKKIETWDLIKLEVNLPNGKNYGEFINNGTGKMVARKFMGHSKTLENQQLKKIEQEINKIWQA